MLKKIQNLLNHSPLWLTYILMTSIFMLALTVILSWSNYEWNRTAAISQYGEKTSELLSLNSENIESYFDDLSNYCVFLTRNNSFYQTVLSQQEATDEDLQDLLSTTRIQYYMRSDLESFEIYLLNQDKIFSRAKGAQHFTVINAAFLRKSTLYQQFMAYSRNGTALLPSAEPDGTSIEFCHSIIRIQDHFPVAVVKIGLSDKRFKTDLVNSNLTLYRSDGTLVYTTAGNDLRSEISLIKILQNENGSRTISLDNTPYLMTVVNNHDYGFYLAAFTPIAEIVSGQSEIRSFSMLQGFLFLMISMVISYIVIRFLTAPFEELAIFQKKLGNGDFAKINLTRSREAMQLSNSYNLMSEQIDTLINENLLARLNANTAKLEALEAQINPHFLYNTLQAIGTEALKNDQYELYEMITRLASNFRYILNQADTVTIEKELGFVRDYVDLQKIRKGERLSVVYEVDHSLEKINIPKCSIQVLVENSITHGIGVSNSSIHLIISVHRAKDAIDVTVSDDGIGMKQEELDRIRKSFSSDGRDQNSSHIGLNNLYTRLMLLYHNSAELIIVSSEGAGTTVTMRLKEKERKECLQP